MPIAGHESVSKCEAYNAIIFLHGKIRSKQGIDNPAARKQRFICVWRSTHARCGCIVNTRCSMHYVRLCVSLVLWTKMSAFARRLNALIIDDRLHVLSNLTRNNGLDNRPLASLLRGNSSLI
jgi:hypothetical protein